MRNSSLFWGLVLIAVGGLFALQAVGLIDNVANFLWPLFLMMLGAWILLGARLKVGFTDGKSFSVDLQGASRVEFDLDHGAGQVTVTGGAPAGVALTGVEATGMEFKSRLVEDAMTIDVEAGPTFLPFLGPEGGTWQFKLSEEVPVSLDVDAGATSMSFDFSRVQLRRFKLDTGASSTSLILPAEGQPFVEINGGAASFDVCVPAGMAARIRVEGGALSMDVDSRFSALESGLYQSSDFENAANRAEIRFDGGASSVTIHS